MCLSKPRASHSYLRLIAFFQVVGLVAETKSKQMSNDRLKLIVKALHKVWLPPQTKHPRPIASVCGVRGLHRGLDVSRVEFCVHVVPPSLPSSFCMPDPIHKDATRWSLVCTGMGANQLPSAGKPSMLFAAPLLRINLYRVATLSHQICNRVREVHGNRRVIFREE